MLVVFGAWFLQTIACSLQKQICQTTHNKSKHNFQVLERTKAMSYYNALLPGQLLDLAFSGIYNERQENRWVVEKQDGTDRLLIAFNWLLSKAIVLQLSEFQSLGAASYSHALETHTSSQASSVTILHHPSEVNFLQKQLSSF